MDAAFPRNFREVALKSVINIPAGIFAATRVLFSYEPSKYMSELNKYRRTWRADISSKKNRDTRPFAIAGMLMANFLCEIV